MNWFLIRRYAPAIVILCMMLHYAYTLHRNEVLLQDNALLSENIKQQQIVLDSIAVRTEEQQKVVDQLQTQLEMKQSSDSRKVGRLLSKPTPSTCVDSIKYLKQEASGIVFD